VEVVGPERFEATLAKATRREAQAVAPGRVAVIVTGSRVDEVVGILLRSGLDAVDPREQEGRGLGAGLVVLAAEGANGLEFDATIVVEPGQIASRGSSDPTRTTPRGLRTLYVAMTRPTRRLAIVACGDLPVTLL
jgi:DNA helicase IV